MILDIEHTRERFLRRPGPPRSRDDEMEQAEVAAAQDVLKEGLRYLPNAETLQRQGRPEREIVNVAAEWQADLVIICPRAEYGGKPSIGPRSVGHIARFVLDHAPCPVLLVRQTARDQFPIARWAIMRRANREAARSQRRSEDKPPTPCPRSATDHGETRGESPRMSE